MSFRSATARIRIRSLSHAEMGRRWLRLGALALAGSVGLAAAGLAAADMQRTKAPADAKLYFITPKDGETVSSPVTVRFGLSGMGVAPAGVDKPNTGHHHLIVDAELPPLGLPIPKDDHHVHFGGGQTQTTLDLSPGKHTLQLLMGDARHIPFDPPVVSKQITITVR